MYSMYWFKLNLPYHPKWAQGQISHLPHFSGCLPPIPQHIQQHKNPQKHQKSHQFNPNRAMIRPQFFTRITVLPTTPNIPPTHRQKHKQQHHRKHVHHRNNPKRHRHQPIAVNAVGGLRLRQRKFIVQNPIAIGILPQTAFHAIFIFINLHDPLIWW